MHVWERCKKPTGAEADEVRKTVGVILGGRSGDGSARGVAANARVCVTNSIAARAARRAGCVRKPLLVTYDHENKVRTCPIAVASPEFAWPPLPALCENRPGAPKRPRPDRLPASVEPPIACPPAPVYADPTSGCGLGNGAHATRLGLRRRLAIERAIVVERIVEDRRSEVYLSGE